MRGIPEERLKVIAAMPASVFEAPASEIINYLIATECQELQEPWMTLDEFLNKPKYEWCWIMLKEGQIHMAYVGYNDSENYVFYLNDFDRDESYSLNEITHVMPIHKPEPQK